MTKGKCSNFNFPLSNYRNLLRPIFLLLLLSFILSACQKSSSENIKGTEFTMLMDKLEDMEGNELKYSENQKLVVHFWATWCKPCIEELPALEKAEVPLEQNNFRVLLVSEETTEEINDFLEKKKIDLESFRYKDALTNLEIYALPTTFVFNEKGEKTFSKTGRINWGSEKEIQEILNLPK